MSIKKKLIKEFKKYNISLDLLDNYEEFGVKNGKIYYLRDGIKEKYIECNENYGLRLNKTKEKKIRLEMIDYTSYPYEKYFLKDIKQNKKFFNSLYNIQTGGSRSLPVVLRDQKKEEKKLDVSKEAPATLVPHSAHPAPPVAPPAHLPAPPAVPAPAAPVVPIITGQKQNEIKNQSIVKFLKNNYGIQSSLNAPNINFTENQTKLIDNAT